MTKITPESSKLTLTEEAHRFRRSALTHSITHQLDSRTSMWIVRIEAWDEYRTSREFRQVYRPGQRNELLGLPVRLTIEDQPDIPMIQLVMEPQALLRRRV